MADTIPMSSLSLAAARRVLDAAIAEAEALAVNVCVAVSDPSGLPIVTARMDGAPRLSADLSRHKAATVTAFNGVPTHIWWPAIADDPALRHFVPHLPQFVILGGGIPVTVDGQLVGAVGVSGASAEQDQAIAETAVVVLS